MTVEHRRHHRRQRRRRLFSTGSRGGNIVVALALFLCASAAHAQVAAKLGGGGLPAPSTTRGAGQLEGDFTIAFPPEPIDGEAPYQEIDNQEGVWRSPHYPPHRPMAFNSAGNVLYALNNHDSRLQVYDATSVAEGKPAASYRVPWLPVALALWTDVKTGRERVLVACRGSWCVAMLDAATGRTIDVHQSLHPTSGRVLGEPGDIIVDAENNLAYVSYSADDMVVELNVASNGLSDNRTFEFPGKHPIFLAFDVDGNVLVTPTLSGNNSVAHQNQANPIDFEPFPRRIIDTADPNLVEPGGGLPDSDVFRIDLATATVSPVVTAAGAIMFAHGINPETQQHWALNTGAENKNPAKVGVHAIRGEFVHNQLSISTLPGVGGTATTPTTVRNLDRFTVNTAGNFVYDANGNFEPTLTMGQPYSLAFTPGGFAVIAAMLTDRLHVLDRFGNFLYSIDLADGDIPRHVLYNTPLNSIASYNWGSNTVKFYTGLGSVPWLTLDLGYDPTPEDVQAGRTLAYDASFSEHNNASCFSCHVDGRTDGLLWDLSDITEHPGLPIELDGADDKGPMLTQTFAGIKRAINFHWRGEQRLNLLDFNDAFFDLLGAATNLDETPGGEFDQFEKFIFSIDNPANPRQHRERVVSDNVQPNLIPGFPVANAASQGQADYINACAGCHSFPLGTNNDNVPDGAVFNNTDTKRIFFKIAPFQEMWRREFDADRVTPGFQQETVNWIDSISDLPDSSIYAPNGAALSHAGLASSLQHFILFFPFTAQTNADITAFIDQWDSGLAPACHKAVVINSNSTSQDFEDLRNYLVPQARDAMVTGSGQQIVNCDLIGYGTSNLGSGPVYMEWVYDRATDRFQPADTTLASRPVNFFINQAQAGRGSMVFVGVPFAMGERFGVDFDNDGFFNGDELTLGTDRFNEDHDGDGFLDGHEIDNPGGDPLNAMATPMDQTSPQLVGGVTVLWSTTKAARVSLETDEPTRVVINWTDSAGGSGTELSEEWSTHHSLVLIDLTPSAVGSVVTVTGTVDIIDRAGLSPTTSVTLPSFTTQGFLGSVDQVKLDSLSFGPWGIALPPATGLAGSATARIVERISAPPFTPKANHIVLARIFRNGQLETNVTGSVPNFDYNGAPYDKLNGPFLVSTVSGANGVVNFNFSLPNASPGDDICLVIEVATEAPVGWDPLLPALPDNAFDFWSFSDTPKEYRKICN